MLFGVAYFFYAFHTGRVLLLENKARARTERTEQKLYSPYRWILRVFCARYIVFIILPQGALAIIILFCWLIFLLLYFLTHRAADDECCYRL